MKLHIEHYRDGLSKKFVPAEGDTQSVVFRGSKLGEYLEKVSDGFCKTIELMRTEGDLTPNGQRKAVRDIATKYLGELRAKRELLLDPIVGNYHTAVANVNSLCRAVDPVTQVQRMELRNHFKTLDVQQRIGLFEKAVQSNDERIITAFVENADIFDLLPKEKLEAGKMQWIEKKNPELAAQYQQSQQVAPFCSYAFRNVCENLCRYLPMKNEFSETLFKKLPAGDLGYVETEADKLQSALPSSMPGMILEETIK